MQKASFAKLDILIADPSAHMTSLIASMLRHLKVGKIAETNSSQLAHALLQSHRFGAIMIDDALAPLDGIQLTRKLRANPDGLNRDTPVIMLSSAPDAARIAEARDAGITEFLRKPFAATHIASRLESILLAPRAFVASEDYAGPDRRRKKVDPAAGERRS